MVSREKVLAIAHLARLTFTPSEIDRLEVELSAILRHIETLRQLTRGGDDADATPQSGAEPAPLRPDIPGADTLAVPLSAIAPEWHEGFFTVPRLRGVE